MSYWQLFYHIVWATKNREPILTPQVEAVIHGFLQNKALGLEATVHALDGYLDHVHMVVSIPPKIAVSKFVGQVKAVASVRYNQANPQAEPFYWQEEFGVFSFDRKRLPNFVAYVQRQKYHHAQNNLIPVLERDLVEEILHEPPSVYGVADAKWWCEMLEA
jgi:REP element-mobilizing transposase RayT